MAALALVVPGTLLGIAPPALADPGDPAVPRMEPAEVLDVPAAGPVASITALSFSGVAVFGHAVTARVEVRAPGGTPTGQVQVLVDGQAAAVGDLGADGTVRVPLPASVAVGRHTVTALYAGVPAVDPPVLSSTSSARPLTVTKTLPSVRTEGTDWSVRRVDPKAMRIQVLGSAGVEPTGRVEVWVNGSRAGSAKLDPSGEAVVNLVSSTRTALVVVTYGGDDTYLPWIASPRLLVVR
jgi:beta-glucosidase